MAGSEPLGKARRHHQQPLRVGRLPRLHSGTDEIDRPEVRDCRGGGLGLSRGFVKAPGASWVDDLGGLALRGGGGSRGVGRVGGGGDHGNAQEPRGACDRLLGGNRRRRDVQHAPVAGESFFLCVLPTNVGLLLYRIVP